MDKGPFNDDASLIRSCIAKDRSAWDFFTKKYSNLILYSIGNRLRKYGLYPKTDDLKEILQNVLSLLWESGRLAEIRNPESLKYWLAVVSGNAALLYMKRQARITRLAPVSLSEIAGDTELVELLPSKTSTPAEEIDRSELNGKIDEAIESLPPKERLILKLNMLHGKKYEEIALIMALPRGTVSSCVNRAKEKLRKKLRDYV
jgi:RNA polymerase sigma-70 factor (ECF subfamily)